MNSAVSTKNWATMLLWQKSQYVSTFQNWYLGLHLKMCFCILALFAECKPACFWGFFCLCQLHIMHDCQSTKCCYDGVYPSCTHSACSNTYFVRAAVVCIKGKNIQFGMQPRKLKTPVCVCALLNKIQYDSLVLHLRAFPSHVHWSLGPKIY